MEKPNDLADLEPDTGRGKVYVVLVVTDVLVSPSSVVTEFCDGFSCCLDWEFVEAESFSFSQKRAHCCTATQEEMRYESTQVKAPPLSRRRTRTKRFLEETRSIKVDIEELEDLLGPDDVVVDFRRRLKEARDEEGGAISETFSTDGLSEFLVASRSRWDKYKRKWNAPWRQNSSGSASEDGGKRARNGKEWDGVWWTKENCAHVEVDIEVLESLKEPENQDIFLRHILKYSTRGGSNIFQLFDTSKRQDHFVANRKRRLEGQGKNGARQESVQNEWYEKKPAVTRRDPENAVAAAKLAVSQRRRAMCESQGEALSEDDSVSSTSRESNTCNDALHVVARSLFS